jgi:hypothetical protein
VREHGRWNGLEGFRSIIALHMNAEQSAIITALGQASKGLLFPSESDYPFEPFLWEGKTDGKLTPEALLAQKGYPPNTPVKTLTLVRFFQPATKEEAWHNAEERKTVRRFQELVKTLKQHLSGITVFKVGKITMDVYIVGETKTGDLAGLSTKVVET